MTSEEFNNKLLILSATPINTLAFLGKVLKHQQNENDEFIAENADIINSAQFQSLVQSAIDVGIHSIRLVKENGLCGSEHFGELLNDRRKNNEI